MDKKTLELDQESSGKICLLLLEPFEDCPVEAIPTVLNAFTIALAVLSGDAKRETECETEDHIEQMVLDWLCKVENVGNLNFSKYINLPNK